VRGQEEPELLGWYSDKAYSLVPSGTAVSEQLQTDYAVFATLFSFGADITSGPASVLKSMRGSRFTWCEDGQWNEISVRRGEGDESVEVFWEQPSEEQAAMPS
jgi:hypothetical protein